MPPSRLAGAGRALTPLLPLLLACGDGSTPERASRGAASSPPLSFGVQVIDTTGGGCGPDGQGCARVRLSFPEVVDDGGPASAPVRAWVSERILDFSLEEPGEIPLTPRDWIRAFFDSHARFRADFPGAWGGWFIEREIHVARNDGDVVALVLTESSYLGGAHPNSVVVFHNVDARSGEVLDLVDLVRPDAREALEGVVSSAVRRRLGVEPGGSLVEAGLMDEILPLPASALLTRDGVLLEYNPYEVGPYAMGAIRALVPWSDLAPLLRDPDRWIPPPPA
jgi:hypothetical protein